MSVSLYTFLNIFKRDLVNIVLNPVLLFTNTVFPLLLIGALGYLGRGAFGGEGVTSYDYYGVTILIFMVINVSMTASNSFMEKSLKAGNLRLLFAPVGSASIWLAKIAATFTFTTACLLMLLLLCPLLYGINLGGAAAGYVAAILVMFNFFSSVVGVLFCCIFKSEEVSNKILSTFNYVCALLGGIFFRVGGLGRTVETLSWASPVKWAAEGIFRIIYDGDVKYFFPTLLALGAAALLAAWGCQRTFKGEDYV